MSQAIPGLTADPLFVGATRPPMRWGVTYSALLFNMVFVMEAFLVTKNLLILLLSAPIHGVCMLLCARDARFFDLILLWARTRLPALFANHRLWKSSSYSPLTVDLPDDRGRRRRADIGVAIPGRPAATCAP
ncbi:MAG: VirB3 family type IV secretion system protein [Steroidobacteraceae bacterium]